MKMGENFNSGEELYLSSWRSADDPSPGDFIYKIEYIVLPQLVLRTATTKKFRSGPWNGLDFNGLPMLPNTIIPDRIAEFNGGKLMLISDPYNNSLITRLTVNQSGSIQRYILDGKKSRWTLLYTIPSGPCDNYDPCGANGVCNANRSPMCRCLKGFTPKFQQQWDQLDWSNGCVMEPRVCQPTDGYFNVSGIKLPDLLQSEVKINMTPRECEALCKSNCSCTAYTNPYVTAGNYSCLLWYGDLVDIREFGDEKKEQNIYIRLPFDELGYSSDSSRSKKRELKIILISVASGVLFLSLICGCLIFIRKRREGLRRKREGIGLPIFEIHTITSATRNFSIENMIGKGGFGPVYKGNLSTGQEVAVKRLSKNSGQGAQEFKNELILIAKLQHRNLVRLLGCCIHGEEMILIYEYMQNESLDHFIFDSHKGALLTWPKRFNIIMDIARGLLYLHQDSRLKIIHRDMKASNILLDSNLQAKISDFGLARIFGGDETYETTKRVIGTYGYMAPEYAVDGKFSVKSDVFSMGVLILEIVSGKKNRSFSHPDHHHNLVGHAWLLWNENKSVEIMDATLKDSFVESEVRRCIHVGLLCVQKLAENRPSMSSVLFMLGNEGAILAQPSEPGFFLERSSMSPTMHESGQSSSTMRKSGQESFNVVTGDIATMSLTEMEPR